MNDIELDQLLNTWGTPSVPASMRASVRACFHARPERKKLRWPRRFLFAAVVLGLVAVTLALPQTLSLISPRAKPPYVVDSEVVRYAKDGTPSLEVSIGSYNNNGSEIVLYNNSPSLLTTMWLDVEAAGSIVSRLTLPFVFRPDQLEKLRATAFVRTGLENYALGSADALLSTCVGGRANETIRDHPTVAVHSKLDERRRMTLWMAPDLGCFALRITIVERQPDGTLRLILRKQATKVTLNR
jgi:hypothetical protein